MYRLMTVPDHMLRGENNNKALVGRNNFLGAPYIGMSYLDGCFGCGHGRECCHSCFHPDIPTCCRWGCNASYCCCIVRDDDEKSTAAHLVNPTQASAPDQPQTMIKEASTTSNPVVPATPPPK